MALFRSSGQDKKDPFMTRYWCSFVICNMPFYGLMTNV